MLSSCAKAALDTKIVVFSIGKADAILLYNEAHAVLIDTGEKEDGEKILSYLQKQQITALDALIVTHFDKDHVGGADTILMGIPVYAVYDADYDASSKRYREYELAIQAARVPRYRVTQSIAMQFGDISVEIMPTSLQPEEDNDKSLVVYAKDAWHGFIFMADAEETRIQELLTQGVHTADVIKMPHHGEYHDNLPALMDTVKVNVAVITDSAKNPADDETVVLLEKKGVTVYQTKNGAISISSNHTGIAVTQ